MDKNPRKKHKNPAKSELKIDAEEITEEKPKTSSKFIFTILSIGLVIILFTSVIATWRYFNNRQNLVISTTTYATQQECQIANDCECEYTQCENNCGQDGGYKGWICSGNKPKIIPNVSQSSKSVGFDQDTQRLIINQSDKACTSDQDCINTISACSTCDCGQPINKQHKNKYIQAYQKYCTDYSGPVCDLYCMEKALKCENQQCVVSDELLQTDSGVECLSDDDCWCKNFTGAEFIPGKAPSQCDLESKTCKDCVYF